MEDISDNLERFVGEQLQEYNECDEMVFEAQRYLSFKNAPKSLFKVSTHKLAEAGFFYVPSRSSSDTVQCAFCGTMLGSWEPNDDPWTEHREHTKTNAMRKGVNCPFVSLGKAEREMTVKELRDIIKARFDLILENLRNDMVNFIANM